MVSASLLDNYNFHHTYTVELDHPMDVVFPVLGRADDMARAMSLIDVWSDVELQTRDAVRLPDDGTPLSRSCVRMLPACDEESSSSMDGSGEGEGESVSNGSGGSTASNGKKPRVFPRQAFTYNETVPAIFGLVSHTTQIVGAQTWDEEAKVSLFETYVPAHGIDAWHVRVFEEVDADDGSGRRRTKISETIKGKAPLWLKYLAQKETVKLHREHMDLYHKLFI